MKKNDDWRRFFDAHAPVYMDNVFTKNTIAEVDFVVRELRVKPGDGILDMGCGTGRHSVELAKRGFSMTGVDLSAGMLKEARAAAGRAGVQVELIQADATRVNFRSVFDGAICLCEGAFGLLSRPDSAGGQGMAILRNISRALKPGGRLVLTVLNGLNKIRQFSQADVDSGKFDPVHLVEKIAMEWDSPSGKQSGEVFEKGYAPDELMLLAESAELLVEHLGGGTAGDWGRRAIKLDEMELMLIAEKASA